MANKIHPTAVIDDAATLGTGIEIGPYCVVGPDIVLGDGVKLHSHVVLDGITTVGEETEIFPFASIGSRTQDKKYDGEPAQLIIGARNIIREHVTMNPGTKGGGMKTVVGDQNLFMVGTHVAHDCYIGNNVIMANNATLGGHVHVGDYAVIGGLAAVHQFVRIGAYAVIGGMSGVENDVIPFGRVKGERAFLAGLNLIGLERQGFSKDEVKKLQKAFNQLFNTEGTLESRMETVASEFSSDELVMNIIRFAREKSRFTLCQPSRKAA